MAERSDWAVPTSRRSSCKKSTIHVYATGTLAAPRFWSRGQLTPPLTCVKMGLSITGRTRDEVGSRSPMVIFYKAFRFGRARIINLGGVSIC